MSNWTGSLLGKVRVGPLIARGGMAEVYLGLHTTLQREVAVKILRAQYQDDPDLLERFQREAQVVAKLRHQNVVQVFDYDTVEDHPYIVMEYIKGPSLSKYLAVLHKKSGRLELPEIARILTGVAHALQYAHDGGVIHRDIKPGNILLTSHTTEATHDKPLPRDFQPVLTDFGLVRFLNSARQTTAGQTAGTPAYMSPEQARGEVTDGRTDIYSLGIVLYEMLAGKIPFDGETTVSILMKHLNDPPPPIPGLSVNLQKVLSKALAKNRDARFQKPADFATAFSAAVGTEVDPSTFMGMVAIPESEPVSMAYAEPVDSLIVVESPKALAPSAPLPARRQRWMPAVALGVVAILGISGALFLLNGSASTLPTPSEGPTASATLSPTATEKPISGLTNASDAAAILHFKDADAVMDQAWLEILEMPPPPPGTEYEAFLVGPDNRLSLGVPILTSDGKGNLYFNGLENENLLGLYDQVEIVLRLAGANSSRDDRVAYTYTLPDEATLNLRQLLVSSAGQPAVLHSLSADARLMEEAAIDLKNALTAGDHVSVRKHSETILNILVGSDSPDRKDWNGDGIVSTSGSGFGFMFNGENPGHIRSIYAHTDRAVNAPGANINITFYGGRVKACAENLDLWVAELRGELQDILIADQIDEVRAPTERALDLIEKINNGTDPNRNGVIEPIAGECGVATLYTSAYAMADLPLLPVDLNLTATATATGSSTGPISTVAPTSGSGGGGGGGGGPQPTAHVPPGQIKTEKPKPTEKPNPGGGGGNNNKP